MFNTIKTAFKNFVSNEEGASGIEYALIAAMIAIALSAFTKPINGLIKNMFTTIQSALTQ